ncbi:MAG: YkgJ family cysteine cluster protein [Methanocalculus sp. MSAO_Arc1]|uniref:YkgJ family cysteine cluster protein n=1 Tax=Methanocalculus TaxID=71151 RepID=UPI000FEFA94F|nr:MULTISPECIES: YkgJ family cysteine cluster protein [unclassified Methanocalculus]MCP1662671.1 Fe-S-cluster containining protein [Methanocalculus sp. AMF5]RQD80298.1 MAG: YkgJ family cysteine cluster protein [Methanocalculus sp. MSAO_Arc1]
MTPPYRPGWKGSIQNQILTRRREEADLLTYPANRLVEIIRDVGFACEGCGRCCTASYNGHVFLLERDLPYLRRYHPDALVPAPDFEYGDQHGTLYVSGYALRVHGDGRCTFLDDDNRCRIYDNRFSICCIYPYMLHREPDGDGVVDWRQIAGLGDHGEYHCEIDSEEAGRIADLVFSYELDFIRQQIGFWEAIDRLFDEENLRHVRKAYDQALRTYRKGEPVRVLVYAGGSFEEHLVKIDDHRGF